MESNEQNKLTKWGQTNGYREQTDCFQGREPCGLGKEAEGIKQQPKKIPGQTTA